MKSKLTKPLKIVTRSSRAQNLHFLYPLCLFLALLHNQSPFRGLQTFVNRVSLAEVVVEFPPSWNVLRLSHVPGQYFTTLGEGYGNRKTIIFVNWKKSFFNRYINQFYKKKIHWCSIVQDYNLPYVYQILWKLSWNKFTYHSPLRKKISFVPRFLRVIFVSRLFAANQKLNGCLHFLVYSAHVFSAFISNCKLRITDTRWNLGICWSQKRCIDVLVALWSPGEGSCWTGSQTPGFVAAGRTRGVLDWLWKLRRARSTWRTSGATKHNVDHRG